MAFDRSIKCRNVTKSGEPDTHRQGRLSAQNDDTWSKIMKQATALRRSTMTIVAAATLCASGIAVFGGGTAFADSGTCITSRICTSYVTITGQVPGDANTTYRFDTNDDDLRDNNYGNGSNVDNDTPSVRNRESFNRACGYLNPVGQSGNVQIWTVTSAANGFVPVDARTSALRRYSGSGAVPSASTCPASL